MYLQAQNWANFLHLCLLESPQYTKSAKEGKNDIYQELLRLRHETKDIHLLMFSPNMLMVSISLAEPL